MPRKAQIRRCIMRINVVLDDNLIAEAFKGLEKYSYQKR